MPNAIDLPPVWLALFLGITKGLDVLMPWSLFGDTGRTVGTVLVLLGLGLLIGAVLQLALARTTFIPRRDPSALVTNGIFRLSRNPIYLGDALVLAGAILWWDVPLAAPLLPVFMLLIQHRFIMGEEAGLVRAFPEEFRAWSSRVRRWL